MRAFRFWMWKRLTYLADRIAPEMAFRQVSISFTFERNVGIRVYGANDVDDQIPAHMIGCQLWYQGEENYERAHTYGSA